MKTLSKVGQKPNPSKSTRLLLEHSSTASTILKADKASISHPVYSHNPAALGIKQAPVTQFIPEPFRSWGKQGASHLVYSHNPAAPGIKQAPVARFIPRTLKVQE